MRAPRLALLVAALALAAATPAAAARPELPPGLARDVPADAAGLRYLIGHQLCSRPDSDGAPCANVTLLCAGPRARTGGRGEGGGSGTAWRRVARGAAPSGPPPPPPSFGPAAGGSARQGAGGRSQDTGNRTPLAPARRCPLTASERPTPPPPPAPRSDFDLWSARGLPAGVSVVRGPNFDAAARRSGGLEADGGGRRLKRASPFKAAAAAPGAGGRTLLQAGNSWTFPASTCALVRAGGPAQLGAGRSWARPRLREA
jgi:hypothetical protein